ncbi:MAG: proton-conducting transporter membrane subunit, partial [Aggregatilineales bacterium]
MDILLVLPILVPMFTAILCVLAWQKRDIQRSLAVGGSLGLLIVGLSLLSVVLGEGIQVTAIGSWSAPFGIVLVADLFGTIMVIMAGLVGSAVTIFSLVSVDETRRSFGYYPVLLILLMGVCGASLTGDMFNLYVWFEIMLITSFVLLTLGSERVQLEGAIKYFALNLLVSAFFLTAVGVLYGLTGSLNMAALAQILPQSEHQGLVTVLAMIFLVTFGIKSAMFPLFFWLPASYHTPPVAVTTLFSGLMTKVGVYAMIRVFTLMFTNEASFTHNIILIMAGLTMFTGVVGAVAQYDFRRLLSFHIISQIGYLMMGLGLFTVASLTGTIFFMIHVIIAKSALFLVSGVSNIISGTYDLKKLGGLYKGYPVLAVLFFIPAMALGGIPPLSGFWAKLALVRAGLEQE